MTDKGMMVLGFIEGIRREAEQREQKCTNCTDAQVFKGTIAACNMAIRFVDKTSNLDDARQKMIDEKNGCEVWKHDRYNGKFHEQKIKTFDAILKFINKVVAIN